MGGKLEKVDERRFATLLRRLGGDAIKVTQQAGDPDRLCWLPAVGGWKIIWFWSEWKRPGLGEKGLSKVQVARHKELRDAGHTVHVFDDYNDALNTVRSYRPISGAYAD